MYYLNDMSKKTYTFPLHIWSAKSGIWIFSPLIKKLSNLDPLWQNILDPRMESQNNNENAPQAWLEIRDISSP